MRLSFAVSKGARIRLVMQCAEMQYTEKTREGSGTADCWMFSERLCTASGAYKETSPDLLIILHLKLVLLLPDISEKN